MNGEEDMMLEDRLFDQTWIQELSNEDFRMLMYLFHFASKKTGILELNMRMLNFASNTGKAYTKEDILKRFGNMICMLPNRENTAIFPDWIATNWAKNGKPIDVVRNPLFKSVVQELASFGLTIDDINELSKKKILIKDDGNVSDIPNSVHNLLPVRRGLSKNDFDVMFDSFWKAYPSECPRKVDKKKCSEKMYSLLSKEKEPVSLYNKIMNGLNVWIDSDMWKKDNGQFICAPLVWLNRERWNDTPAKNRGNGKYVSKESKGLF